MERILIIGSPGAGKSTLARQLASRKNLPVIHLDQLYWQPGWREPEKQAWRAKLEQVLQEKAWIMDGHFGATLEMRLAAADTVILLDLPRRVCIWRILKRLMQTRGSVRKDMAAGCPERLNAAFLKIVWDFQQKNLPRALKKMDNFHGRLIVLRSAREVSDFLKTEMYPELGTDLPYCF